MPNGALILYDPYYQANAKENLVTFITKVASEIVSVSDKNMYAVVSRGDKVLRNAFIEAGYTKILNKNFAKNNSKVISIKEKVKFLFKVAVLKIKFQNAR